jgi:hypothetical protein
MNALTSECDRNDVTDHDEPGVHDILLDSQCQDIFCNVNLVQNVQETNEIMTVTGQVEGATFSTNTLGKFLNFKDKVYFSPQARANLLSFSRVWRWTEIKKYSKDSSEFSYMIFREINHLFICDIRNDIIGDHSTLSFVSHIEVNKKNYTQHQINQADQAHLFLKMLGFPSNRDSPVAKWRSQRSPLHL